VLAHVCTFAPMLVRLCVSSSPGITPTEVRSLFLPTAEGLVGLWSSTEAPPAVPPSCGAAFARTALQGSQLGSLVEVGTEYLVAVLTSPVGLLKYFGLNFYVPDTGVPVFTSVDLPSTCSLETVRMRGNQRAAPRYPGRWLCSAFFPGGTKRPCSPVCACVTVPSPCLLFVQLAAGNGCAGMVVDPASGTSIHVALDSCPGSSLPYLSVGCSGGGVPSRTLFPRPGTTLPCVLLAPRVGGEGTRGVRPAGVVCVCGGPALF
jgi:hypothetical protein